MTTLTVNTSGDWGVPTTYDGDDVILDGTSSPITVNVVAHNYGGWTEGDTANSNFHSPTMTIKGNVTFTGDGYLSSTIRLRTTPHPSLLNRPTLQ
nr:MULTISPECIES: hypothetical protein [Acetobacter]